MRMVLTGNHTAAYAAKLARVEVVAAYPITPQTQIVEKLSEIIARGELKAEFIKVESEHSAMAACIGASAAGARAFTATSSQGLALMHELLHWAAGARLPIVMANVNRAMAPPWNIWCDHNDSISQRDTGWMQIYCENNQEVMDSIIQAFKVAESVRLPVMVNLDGFYLSHTAEPVEFPNQDEVDKFLPKYDPEDKLDPENPFSYGAMAVPENYAKMRYNLHLAMQRAKRLIKETGTEYGRRFGRYYDIVDPYKCDDAEVLLISTSTIASTAKDVIDVIRDEGKRVGLLRIRWFRPFPMEDIRKVARKVQKICVIDRDLSFGFEGAISSEVKAALYPIDPKPQVYGFLMGIGGMDVTPEEIEKAIRRTIDGEAEEFNWDLKGLDF
ncbi:TPA: pyruvate ferredoxin oxidoreductase [Candidatus Poribacteria bacterium]|nr:pyruvate ferredoxin oxidoreductase [Candidatus Poribacteria bacterium]HEX30373.1 pyruvate ferredoxin oxidoreductase [Candidatus Poribacteria bacterium]